MTLNPNQFRLSHAISFALIIVLIGISHAFVRAEDRSVHCQFLDSFTFGPLGGSASIGGLNLLAGEEITINNTTGTAVVTVTFNGSVIGTATVGGSLSFTVATDVTGVSLIMINNTGSGTIGGTLDCAAELTEIEETEVGPVQVFFDGRVNDFDSGNPVVLFGINYGDDQWGLEVYSADQTGLIFNATPEQIAAIPECPDTPTMIAQSEASGIALYRLPQRTITDDEVAICPFQLNAPTGEPGKVYIIVFDTLYHNTYYESWEEFIFGN